MSIAAILAALAGGVAISMQSLFSGTIGQKVGIMGSAFVVHLTGLLLAGVIMLFLRGGQLAAWRTLPPYLLTAGFLGVGIVASISYAVPRLGLATTLTITIVAQLTLGALLDHYGLLGTTLRPLDFPRALGLLALFLGTWLIVR